MIKNIYLKKNRGSIFKAKDTLFQKIKNSITKNKEIDSKTFDQQKDVVETLNWIEGEWTSYLDIQSKRYWTRNEDSLNLLEVDKNALPSDSRFRLDSLYLKLNDETMAQKEKENLETIQREDKEKRNHKNKTSSDDEK